MTVIVLQAMDKHAEFDRLFSRVMAFSVHLPVDQYQAFNDALIYLRRHVKGEPRAIDPRQSSMTMEAE